MTYVDANRRIGVGEPQLEVWPADTPVWLVIFRGRWDLMPMGPPGATLRPQRYEGCLYVLFAARDSTLISAGDALCPSG